MVSVDSAMGAYNSSVRVSPPGLYNASFQYSLTITGPSTRRSRNCSCYPHGRGQYVCIDEGTADGLHRLGLFLVYVLDEMGTSFTVLRFDLGSRWGLHAPRTLPTPYIYLSGSPSYV